jgi:hypothetical protein
MVVPEEDEDVRQEREEREARVRAHAERIAREMARLRCA